MITFFIITSVIVLIVILLNTIKIKPKKNSITMLDELTDIAATIKPDAIYESREINELYEAIKPLSIDGTEKDMMPEGFGEFGLEITNPIPVNTIIGCYSYLGQLRTLDGSSVEYDRIGSMNSPNINSIIDGFIIKSDGKEIAIIYICSYNKKNSERAPKGFKLSQFSSL